MRAVVAGLLGAALLAGFAASWSEPVEIATLANPLIVESSGIAPSHRNPGLYWTHNDSGSPAQLFLFDAAGRDRGTYSVTGSTNRDWEDIAVGPGPEKNKWYVYIGDIGDNGRKRKEVVVYRLPEPASGGGATETPTPIRLRYPDGPHDAETLIVHPRTSDIYIVSKAHLGDPETAVYKGGPALKYKGPITMIKVAVLQLPPQLELALIAGRITGGDVTSDGKRVVLCDYLSAYEAELPQGKAFDAVWSQPWHEIDAGRRWQGEGVCYRLDGRALLFTSEGHPCPLWRVLRQ